MTNSKSAHLFPKQKFTYVNGIADTPIKQPYYDKPTATFKKLEENVLRVATDQRMSYAKKERYVALMMASFKLENNLQDLK